LLFAQWKVDNPAARNAFTGPMMLDLAAVVGQLRGWRSGRAVVVTGSGGHFCAGADFSLAAAALAPSEGLAMHDLMAQVHK